MAKCPTVARRNYRLAPDVRPVMLTRRRAASGSSAALTSMTRQKLQRTGVQILTAARSARLTATDHS